MTDADPNADASTSDSEEDTAEMDTGEKIKHYAPWIIGALLMFSGFDAIFAPEGSIIRSIVAGILLLAAGAVAFPVTRDQIDARIDPKLTSTTVIAIVVVSALAGGIILPQTTTDQPDADVEGGEAAADTPTETPADGASTDSTSTEAPATDEETPANSQTKSSADGANADADATPTDEEASTSTDRPQGIQQVAAETFSDYGMVTGISPDGSYAVFGLHTGEFKVYSTETGSFESRQTRVDRSPSHIQLRNDGYATVAWMDAHVFGGIDFTTGGGVEWANEYDGLWDIGTNADHSHVAAVTSPSEGVGRVGVTTDDGTNEWDESLEDAGSQSVAMTNDGDRVAVGAVNYWTQSGDTAGTPGVHMYDGQNGEELWRYETETEAWMVDIHGDEELVTATTDERVIVLDFEGNVVWEQETSGSLWVAISEDGSTVATIDEGKPVAYEAASGKERWRADAAPSYIYGDRIGLSADGSRVIATESIGWTYVLDDGEIIWQEKREDNPANVDISADGTTWSVIVQDNDSQEAHVFVYRDHAEAE